jgi:phage terminase large subunit GpA-like protein
MSMTTTKTRKNKADGRASPYSPLTGGELKKSQAGRLSCVGHRKSVWTQAERQAWRRAPVVSTSQWADRHRVVDTTSSESGPWRTARVPYLRAIMDAYDDPEIEEITITGPARCGKTEATFNMMAKTVATDPMPILYATAVEGMIPSISRDRLAPMFEKSPELAKHLTGRDWDLQGGEFRFLTMPLYFVGLQSAVDLASRAIGRLFVTETDKSPDTLRTEGNPIRLAFRRGQTYPDFKAVYDCTPTTEEGFINVSFNRSNMQRFYVPCPQCGGYQVPKFGRLKVDPPDLRDKEIITKTNCVYYECEHCGYHIPPYQRDEMSARGVWCPAGCTVNRDGILSGTPKRGKLHTGFWIPALVSPWHNWAKLLAEWFELQSDPVNKKGRLQEFRNQVMAEIWEEEGTSVSYEHLKKNIGIHPRGAVPSNVRVLVAGADPHKNDMGQWRIDYMIMGFAPGRKRYVIAAGSAADKETLFEETIMQDFSGLAVDLEFIDSGDEAMEIYEWAMEYPDIVKPTKGIDFLPEILRPKKLDRDDPKHKKRRRKIPDGLILWEVGTNELKDKVAAILENDRGATDSIEFYADISPHVLMQICGEHKVKERRRGHVVGVWKPKREHGDVHFWDTLILCEAAGRKQKALLLRDESEPDVRVPAAMRNKVHKKRVRMGDKPRRYI